VGPGAKQRYMDAKVLVDRMKAGMDEPTRIKMAAQLTELLEKYIRSDEGDIQYFVLLALGRVWQVDQQGLIKSEAAVASRERVVETLTKHFNATQVPARKAAILALSFWKGNPEARSAMPALIERLDNAQEDVDVRIAAAVALGSIASPGDADVIRALSAARSSADGPTAELGWNAALALARLNQPEATDTLLKLLNRNELAGIQVYDREKDPRNPVYRKLSDLEQERFLINALEVARHMDDPRVRARVKQIADADKSPRVRAAAIQSMNSK
jgi:HEAT repeat protein